jgi:hypothetical protein
MSKVLSFRVSDDEALWADEYAKGRGVSRQDFLAAGFRSYREDCERGVPDVPKAPVAPESASDVRPPLRRGLTASQAAIGRELGWMK